MRNRDVKKRIAFSLVELMVAVAIIGILVSVLVPNLIKTRAASFGASTIGALNGIAKAQVIFKENLEVDQNFNGSGEYGLLGELAGGIVPRGATQLISHPYIGQFFDTRGREGDGTTQKAGYVFRVYLPLTNDSGRITEAGDDETLGGTATEPGIVKTGDVVHDQELYFVCYAWPQVISKSGQKAFVINEAGVVHFTSMTAKRYESPTLGSAGVAGPDPDAAYVGEMFTSSLAAGELGNDGNKWFPTSGL